MGSVTEAAMFMRKLPEEQHIHLNVAAAHTTVDLWQVIHNGSNKQCNCCYNCYTLLQLLHTAQLAAIKVLTVYTP